jgi:hypothetical protein
MASVAYSNIHKRIYKDVLALVCFARLLQDQHAMQKPVY